MIIKLKLLILTLACTATVFADDPKLDEIVLSDGKMTAKRGFSESENDAEAVYLQGLEPSRPEPYILQAQILTVLKEPRRARQAIEKAIELDPKFDLSH